MNRLLCLLIVGSTLCASFATPLAARAERKGKPNTKGLSDLITAIKLPSSIDQLSLDVLSADVLIKHEKRDDIHVRVNYPKHWAVNDKGSVQQNDVARCIPGIYHTQNGNNFLGMGTVPGESKINMTANGIYVNGRLMPMEKRVSKPNQTGVEVSKEGIFVNGHKLAPFVPDRGFDAEVDVIQVLVPEDFHGALDLRSRSTFTNKLDSWSGGSLKLFADGRGTIEVSKISTRSSSCELSAANSAHVIIEDLESPSVTAKATVKGEVEVRKIACSTANVYVDGNGSIHLGEGNLGTCNATTKDESQFTLGDSGGQDIRLKSSTVKLDSSGNSKTFIMNAAIDFLSVATANSAKLHATGAIGRLEQTNDSKGGLVYTDIGKLMHVDSSQ